MTIKNITLNDGNFIPQIGLGTWRIKGSEKVKRVLRSAIKNGYTHIDTAYVYENEEDIGNALSDFYKEGLIKRENLFITSKLWNSFHERSEEGLMKTLNDLKTKYIDLYLIHWPVNFEYDESGNTKRDEKGNPILKKFDVIPLWRKMEEFVEKGFVKSIGVANFGIENLKLVLNNCKIKPAVNQFEMHPYLKQNELVNFCFKNGIIVESYSSLGSEPNNKAPKIMNDAVLKKIADKKNVGTCCIILSWLVQKGIVVIPKSSSEEHLIQNLSIVNLEPNEILEIENIDIHYRYVNDDVIGFGPDRFK